MFKIHNVENINLIPKNENIFMMYLNKILHPMSNLTLSHIIIDLPYIDENHLNGYSNCPNICIIDYKNYYSPANVFDFDVINCNKYICSENKYIHVRKALHYDGGLKDLYKNYIVDDIDYDSSYYNIIKYYHNEYMDFKPAFDKIIEIYEKIIKNNRNDILKYLNIPLNGFIITCDTNTIMYENYINTGMYDLDKSIILKGLNDVDYENKNDEWNNKLHCEKIIHRYEQVISYDERFNYKNLSLTPVYGSNVLI